MTSDLALHMAMTSLVMFLLVICMRGVQSIMVIIQHPANDTYCEGTDSKLRCVIFDNTTASVADNTGWINADTLGPVAGEMISNTRDGDVLTSELTLENVLLSDNGARYFCVPKFGLMSFVGMISVIVPLMTAPNITAIAQLSSTSFNVNWTITGPGSNYIITWTNLRTGVMDNMKISENTNSYTVTGLSGMDNYNVTVTTNNSCGMMMSDPITVYDPPQIAPMIIMLCREMDITNESFVVQWDAVNDVFPVTYTVRWFKGDNLIDEDSVDGLSYTVTGLTANTSYNVTVVAVNTCCGAGPVSNTIFVTTNNKPPTFLTTATTVTIITITRAATITATPTLGGLESCSSSSSLSTGAAAAIGCVVTFVVTLIATAIITFVMAYICVEKKLKSITQHTSSEQPKSIANAIVYDTVGLPNQTSSKGDLELQPNPAYGTSHKMIMDINPAYESCK